MAPTKPTIVLIPGSFCSAALMWDAVIDKLHSAGFDTVPVELPTISPPSTRPGKTMYDDAEAIHGVVESLTNDDKDILLVMSSYGGIPGTQSLKGITKKERQDQGTKGGVVGLVYAASVLPNEGESSDESFAAFGAPTEGRDFVKMSGDYLSWDPVPTAAWICSDLPKEEGEAFTRKAMSGHSFKSFSEKMTSTSHYDVPITYIHCTNDRCVLPPHQKKMIDDIKSVSRSSVNIMEMASGHCPMLSHVGETAEVIMNAAEKV